MIISQPTMLENMELKDNVYRSISGWTKKNAALHFLVQSLLYGQSVSLTYFRRSGGFNVFGNWKPFRMWSLLGAKPNTYIGSPRADNLSAYPWRLFTEDLIHTSSALKEFSGRIPFGDDVWHREVVSFKIPSAYAKADGLFSITIDDKVILNMTNWQNEGDGYPGSGPYRGLPTCLCIQLCYQDNGTGPLPETAYCHVANPVVEIR